MRPSPGTPQWAEYVAKERKRIAEAKVDNAQRAEYERGVRANHVALGYCEQYVDVYIGQLFGTIKLCDKKWKGVRGDRHLCHIHLKKADKEGA